MNRLGQWLCRSDRWRSIVAERLPGNGNADLCPKVLAIGPALATDLPRTAVCCLTALEIDPTLAGSLR